MAALSLALLSTACGKTAKVTLQLAKSGGSISASEARENPEAMAATNADPTSLKMKLVAAYLSEDIDPVTQNNTGNTQMFWLNNDCNDDISNCGLNGETYQINSFFDFTDPTEANTALNSQGRDIDVGTYKYVRVEFCKYGASSPNVEFVSQGQTFQVKYNGCGVTSAVMDPPLQVQADQSVKITLAYSLANTINIEEGGSTGDNCGVGTGANDGDTFCFNSINFTPSATIE